VSVNQLPNISRETYFRMTRVSESSYFAEVVRFEQLSNAKLFNMTILQTATFLSAASTAGVGSPETLIDKIELMWHSPRVPFTVPYACSTLLLPILPLFTVQ